MRAVPSGVSWWTLVQQKAASFPSRSWRRKPAGSNHGCSSRWRSVSRSQPPCSGCQLKARLLTSSHASSSWPGTNGPHVDRRLLVDGEGPPQLAQLPAPGQARPPPPPGRGRRWAWAPTGGPGPPPSWRTMSRAVPTSVSPMPSPAMRWWGSTTYSRAHGRDRARSARVLPGQLGVADGVVVARLPRHQPGEAVPVAVDEVEPLVLAEGVVAVDGGGHVEQLGHGGDVDLPHLALDLQAGHVASQGTAGIYRSPAHGPAAHPQGTGPGDGRPAGRGVPRRRARPVRPHPRQPVPAAGGHHPLGPDHRREREQGHARPFARYPTPPTWPRPTPGSWSGSIHSTGFFRSKARSLIGMATALEERFGGEVPTAMADLVTLPGVGRKTANVVRSVGFGLPGLPVDTHVGRLSRRLGLTAELDPVRVEADLERHGPGPGAGPAQPAPDPARAPGLPGPHRPAAERACWPISAPRRRRVPGAVGAETS